MAIRIHTAGSGRKIRSVHSAFHKRNPADRIIEKRKTVKALRGDHPENQNSFCFMLGGWNKNILADGREMCKEILKKVVAR